AIAVANPYKGKGKDGMLADESPEQAKARWLGTFDKNSYHSSIVSNPMHSEKATAYDLCIGVSDILKDGDLTWIRFLRAVADWRTNWFGKAASDPSSNKKDPSFSPPAEDLLILLNDSSEIDTAERIIIEENYNYYAISGKNPGSLPDMVKECTLKNLEPHVKSETTREASARKEKYVYGDN
ncbi:effector protein Tle3 domain-containing protein, partial [Janthinobacterium agaricidamnosum]